MESRLDHVYRSLLLTKFFTRGWGHPETLKTIIKFRKILGDRQQAQTVLPKPSDVKVVLTKEERRKDATLIDGHFTSPLAFHHPELCPSPVAEAHFQAVLPRSWAVSYTHLTLPTIYSV